MSKLKIDNRGLKRGYIIHKTETTVLVCKILNEYNTEEEAREDLIELLTHNKNEVDLLKEFSTK